MIRSFDVAIIGAGAAGMFCAAECVRRGRRTVVIDHAKKPGEKIRISGGGRCNFTNLHCAPEAFISENPHFCISALRRYDQHDFIALVGAHGIEWYEKTLGQLFCRGKSTEIVDMLLEEMDGADLWLNTSVERLEATGGGYRLALNDGAIEAESVVIATGGKSIPKMGATDFGYRAARDFGLAVTETRAGLVPYTLDPDMKARLRDLSGIAADVTAQAGGARFAEAMLFTHRGLSGPAMLQASSYWRPGEEVRIAFGEWGQIAGRLKAMRVEHGRRDVATALGEVLPKALAKVLATEFGLSGNLADQSDRRLEDFAGFLSDWRVKPVGTEGYRTAEVTVGGVSTDELDGRTMEARRQPGLYFIGEVADVTGWLGGYNFQWAWSSGWAAGQVA